jgi:hypothetical protein
MKKALFAVLSILLVSVVAYAGVIADGSITVSSTAQSILTVADDVERALITVEGGPVRVSMKTSPYIGTGHLLYNGDTMILTTRRDVVAFRVLLDGSASGGTVYYSLSGK